MSDHLRDDELSIQIIMRERKVTREQAQRILDDMASHYGDVEGWEEMDRDTIKGGNKS